MPDDREDRDDAPTESEEDEAAKLRRSRAFTVLRHSLGLQQQEVASRAGLTRGTVSEYEHAKSSPEATNLERLFRGGLGLPLYALEDAEDFVDYVQSLRGRPGGWRDTLVLRRGEAVDTGVVAEPPPEPYAAARIEQRRIAGAFGRAMGQALLRFFEAFEGSSGASGEPGDDDRGS